MISGTVTTIPKLPALRLMWHIQKGEVQAIGGVNEKIEGYFEVCKAKGLTGSQGVLIPAANEQNLMLKEEVLEAVGDGKFHIWTTKTIDEGIEILTGVRAGTRKEDRTFEEGTVGERVDKRLKELAQTLVRFGKDQGEKEREKAGISRAIEDPE